MKNKFSQNVLKFMLAASLAIIGASIFLFKKADSYYELFIARKLAETGFCFLPLGFGLFLLTDYLYKKHCN